MNITNKSKIKICHMTSAHNSNDTRIFHKECVSLGKYGYDVSLVAHGSSFKKNGINVIGIGQIPSNRFKRMYSFAKEIYEKAISLNADIYHIHDPELLPYAYKLKKKGKKVIFDSHEDYLLTITEKKWIPNWLRSTVSKLYGKYENKVISIIDGAIVCYHWTGERYSKINDNVEMILNFPLLGGGKEHSEYKHSRKIAFAGGIACQWCHKEIIMALDKLKDVEYELAGKMNEPYGQELQSQDGWKYVNYHGVIPHEEVKTKIYSSASIGMCLLDYIAQCKGTIGNLSNTKFFEYMQMGLPVVCTDFKLWKEIVEEEECGVCVNPRNVEEIMKAIGFLLDNPSIAKKMAMNGQQAVLRKYNWGTEEKKLLSLYENILSRSKNSKE